MLARLRKLVVAMQAERHSVPLERLVELAHAWQVDSGITIDFEASAELGEPMIVVRTAAGATAAAALENLTARERQVALLVARGLSNKEIAGRLAISLLTVKDHVHHILEKTGLPNRAAVAAAAVESASGR